MRKDSFERAKSDIERWFDSSRRKAFTEKALETVFNQYRDTWNIASGKRLVNFIAYLKQVEWLRSWKFYKGENNNGITIYSWKTSDQFAVISGLKNNSYFTHYSAMFINGLTEQIPKTFYLNSEHSSPTVNRSVSLTQQAIDGAFSKEQRKATEQYRYNLSSVIMLNGQYTNRLGVIESEHSYCYSDLPRTLIDIAIRPAYAGGVFEVAKVFENAKGKFDPKTLKKYLDKMDFIYPYHQVIGFYLQRAGYSETVLDLIKDKMKYKFYLTYNMKNPQFDQSWNLYYPRGFNLNA